jgi:hypothetical protein
VRKYNEVMSGARVHQRVHMCVCVWGGIKTRDSLALKQFSVSMHKLDSERMRGCERELVIILMANKTRSGVLKTHELVLLMYALRRIESRFYERSECVRRVMWSPCNVRNTESAE